VPVVGDAKSILSALNRIVKPRVADAWNETVREWRGEKLFSYQPSDTEIKPQAVIEKLYEVTGGNAIVCTEVGQHQMWTAHYYRFDKPRTLISSGGLGTMGFGLPAAMGAALACPGRTVVDIAGDGSIQMNIQELATIAINRIPVKVVILNNGYLGMVRQWQDLFYGKRYSATCLRRGRDCPGCHDPNNCDRKYVPDFVALAQSYGIAAFRAEKPAEVEAALRGGLEVDGPALLEFIVAPEENVFPMVPAGKSLDEILEG
jgi:acetolactate synthase-1/2/3 large subunit